MLALLLTSGPNAVQDILNNQRYEGAIDSIQSITAIVDIYFTMFITFIAFFIISAAMLKNVLAGAYCAYPKFWDKVDDAKKEVADTGWVTRIKGLAQGYQNINAGSFTKALLRILPNIKMLTDFEDETVDARSYFIRAIPQMIMIVIIGVFIYNGFYRDTASVVANFGSEMFHRVILSADPVAIYDRITGASGKPEFGSQSDQTDKGQLQYKISSASYGKVLSTYNDIKGSANKTALAGQLDTWVSTQLDKCSDYSSDHDSWKYAYDVSMSVGPTTQANVGKVQVNSEKTKAVYVFDSLPISSLNLDTTKEVGVDWHLNCTVTFTKRAKVAKNATWNNLTWTVNGKVDGKKTVITYSSTENAEIRMSSLGATIDGKKVESIEDGKITVNGKLTINSKSPLAVSGLAYFYDGSQNNITGITLSATTGEGSSYFTQKNMKKTSFGSKPEKKKDEDK